MPGCNECVQSREGQTAQELMAKDEDVIQQCIGVQQAEKQRNQEARKFQLLKSAGRQSSKFRSPLEGRKLNKLSCFEKSCSLSNRQQRCENWLHASLKQMTHLMNHAREAIALCHFVAVFKRRRACRWNPLVGPGSQRVDGLKADTRRVQSSTSMQRPQNDSTTSSVRRRSTETPDSRQLVLEQFRSPNGAASMDAQASQKDRKHKR